MVFWLSLFPNQTALCDTRPYALEKTVFADKLFGHFCVAELLNTSKCSSKSAQSIVSYFYDISVEQDAGNNTVYSSVSVVDAAGTPYADTQAGVDTRLAMIMGVGLGR